MLVTFKQKVIEQYSRFKTREGFLSCCIAQQLPIRSHNITGPNNGEDVFLPQIPLIPSNVNLPFEFNQLQFPVKVCFAMSINKAQGQPFEGSRTLPPSTLLFPRPVLCGLLSRVGSPSNLFINAPGGETRNVVYNEVL